LFFVSQLRRFGAHGLLDRGRSCACCGIHFLVFEKIFLSEPQTQQNSRTFVFPKRVCKHKNTTVGLKTQATMRAITARTYRVLLFHVSMILIDRSNAAAQQSYGIHERNLQQPQQQQQQQDQVYNYRVNYIAEFQQILDPICTANAPIFNVSCRSGQMQLLATSNETIVCNATSESDVTNGTTYRCINTCNGIDCNNVYLTMDDTSSNEGPFGSVQFMCEGNSWKK
jgi:hypothetical protein